MPGGPVRHGVEELPVTRTTTLAVCVLAMLGVLAGCNAATSSGAATAGTAPSAAAPSTAPSAATASEAPSLDLGSFQLPSGAKDLEALLPAQICGETAIKFSMAGADFATGADPEFTKTLTDLGKSPSDVSFASAGSNNGCGVGIFRINGVDQGRLQEVFLATSTSEGSTMAPGNVGGKSVFIISSGETAKQYVYFKGDAVLFAQAPDEAQAASILQALP